MTELGGYWPALATVALLLLSFLQFLVQRPKNHFPPFLESLLGRPKHRFPPFLESLLGRPKHRFPPGPRGWPIVGSMLSLGTLPQRSLYAMSKTYGPLMFLRLGNVKTLVATSPEMARAVLKTNDQIMAGRPLLISADHFFYGGLDIGFSQYGEYWRYLRKVCTVGLLTPTRISEFREIREREALECLQFVAEESEKGKSVNMSECISTITMNNICQIVMSKTFSVLKSDCHEIVPGSLRSMLVKFSETLGAFNLSDFVPLLKPFDPQGLTRQSKECHQKLDKFFDDVIEEHRQRLKDGIPAGYKEDFVDALLGIGQTKLLQQKLAMDSIKATLLDMIAGGADTSSTTALWAIAELMRHPHILKKLKEELDSVVGQNRLVVEEDLPKLKYLDAVIKETYRFHPAVAMLLPHESTQDCEIQGYHIPARTRIFVNAWGIHRDPAVWERPLEFDPDRFLNTTKDIRGQDFDFLPFGAGRRVCPGMNLGSLMVKYMVAFLLHALDLTLSDDVKPEEMDMSEQYGVFLYKKLPLMVSAKARLPNHVIYPPKKVHNGLH